MSEISLKTKEILNKWATKLKVDITKVEAIYNQHLLKVQDEKKARLLTIGSLQEEYGSIASNAPFYYIYVLEDSGVVDIFELMRQKAINMLNDPARHDQALSEGLITEDGTPLDYRKMVFGKLNDQKGMPLVGSSKQRTILALASSKEDFSGPFVGELIARGDFAENLDNFEHWKFYKVRANPGKNSPTRLNLGPASKFQDYNPPLTLAEIANRIPIDPIDDLHKIYDREFAGKKRTNYLSAIRGSVTFLMLQPIYNSRIFALTDEDAGADIRCRISENIPIIFQEADEVLAFCRLYLDKQKKIGAQVRAYMVI